MDNLTHTLVGALIGQTGLKRKTGLAMPAVLIGANIPDVDVSCFLWLDGLEHLAFRRGITHGPPAMVLLPLVLASALWWFDRWQDRRGTRPDARLPVRFGWLYALAFIACLSHPALDWLNAYGVRLLEPFSSRWFYGDTLFIIDLWLWLGLGLATWLSLRRERSGGDWRKPARIALGGALAYIALNYAISHYFQKGPMPPNRPIAIIQNPVPLAFWERETVYGFNDPNLPPWVGVDGPLPAEGAVICEMPPESVRAERSDLDAFLFWSRAPFAERAEDGSVVVRDARFYDPRARGRFSIALPEVPCVELAGN